MCLARAILVIIFRSIYISHLSHRLDFYSIMQYQDEIIDILKLLSHYQSIADTGRSSLHTNCY